MEVIKYLHARIFDSPRPISASELYADDLKGKPGSRGERERILSDYSQKNTNVNFRHWNVQTGSTGGKVYTPLSDDLLV